MYAFFSSRDVIATALLLAAIVAVSFAARLELLSAADSPLPTPTVESPLPTPTLRPTLPPSSPTPVGHWYDDCPPDPPTRTPWSVQPTYTPRPTYTPAPIPTCRPTATLAPNPSPTPYPTATLYPTASPWPTQPLSKQF